MKRTYIICLFIGLSSSLLGQDPADSLKAIWKDENQTDSVRLSALRGYVIEKGLKAPQSTFDILIDELIELSTKQGNNKILADAHRIRAARQTDNFEYAKAISTLELSLEIGETARDTFGQARSCKMIGQVYRSMNKPAKAMKYFQEGLALSEQINDSARVADSYLSIGSILKNAEDLEPALEYFEKALNIYRKQGNQRYTANAISSIASVYRRMGKHDLALATNQKALEIRKSGDLILSVASSYNNIGNLYEDKNDLKTALEYHNKALEIRLSENYTRGIASSYKNLGSGYLEYKDYNKAIYYCTKAEKLYREMGHLQRQMSSCDCLYNAYKKIGSGQKALAYLEERIRIAEEVGIEKGRQRLQALEFEDQILTDSMERVAEKLRIAAAHEMAMSQQEKNRNRALGGLLLAILLAGAFYYRYRLVNQSNAAIQKEKDRAEGLLLNILPASIAEELKMTGEAKAQNFDTVSVLFTDFKGFTEISASLNAEDLVQELNTCFKAFDMIITKYGLEKIKTIGDAYMAAAGLPLPDPQSTKNIVLAALEMSTFIQQRHTDKVTNNEPAFQMRAGIHTGPIVAGIVGVKKFQYDIWGDTVNTASRMESNGEVGKVNISQATYEMIRDEHEFSFESRGKIAVKGKENMAMWFVG